MRQVLRLAAVVMVMLGAATPAAKASGGHGAPKPVFELVTSDLRPGDHAAVFVFSPAAHSCRLVLRAQSFAGRGHRAHQQWRFIVGARAARGNWPVRVSCRTGKQRSTASTTLRVLAGGHAALVRAGSMRATSTAKAPSGDAASTGGRTDVAGRGAAGNPFTCSTGYSWCKRPDGQCTWWAYAKRSDIYDRAVAAGVPPGGLVAGGGYAWDAWRWTGNAQRSGIPT